MQPGPPSSAHESTSGAGKPSGNPLLERGSLLVRQGATSISRGAVLCAISAAIGSVGAWPLLPSFEATKGFGSGSFGIALASSALALAALFVAFAGFRSFDRSRDVVLFATPQVLSRASALFRVGFTLALLELLLIVMYELVTTRFRLLRNDESVVIVVATSIVALILLVSVGLPLLRLSRNRGLLAARLGLLLGLVGLVGEVVVSSLALEAEWT